MLLALNSTPPHMEPRILISRLKVLLAEAPSFLSYSPQSPAHLGWLGKAYALVNQWNGMEARSLKIAADFLSNPAMQEINVAQIFGAIHRAIADLELNLPPEEGQAFGPGAVYDFFKALNELVASAAKSLWVVDPFIESSVFDAYLSSVPAGVPIRVLAKKWSPSLKEAVAKFSAQRGNPIEARASSVFHDRIIFVDGADCWVLGQSIKDAAKSMPTYLAPLSPDVAADKLAAYEEIWSKAILA